MLKINEVMVNKFEEVTGLKLLEIQNTKSNIKLATFDSFSVSDDLNLKLLTAQGIDTEYVKLQSARKTTDGIKVYLFMVKNNKIIKFYPCYVVETKKEIPIVNPSIVSVVPTKADNTRQSKVLTNQVKDNQTVSRSEFNDLNAKIDSIMSMLIADKTVTKKGKK